MAVQPTVLMHKKMSWQKKWLDNVFASLSSFVNLINILSILHNNIVITTERFASKAVGRQSLMTRVYRKKDKKGKAHWD